MEERLGTPGVLFLSSLLSIAVGCGGSGGSTPAAGQAGDDCPAGGCLTECSPGTYLANGACQPLTTCLPGTFVARAGSALTDRICEACPSGTFSMAANSTTCVGWTVCNPGSYVRMSGSTTSDRSCAPCPAGSNTSASNQAQCLTSQECQAGTVHSGATASGATAQCLACHAGQYCAGGSAPAVPCDGDTWDNDGSPTTACVTRSSCLAGSYISSPGSATADRACTPCPSGSFSTMAGASMCMPWTDCPAGTYVSNLPTATTDRVCKACASGTFSTAKNQSACLATTSCAAGTVQTSVPSATGGRTCRACSAGEFCAGGAAPAVACVDDTWDDDGNPSTICVPKSLCPPGTYVSQVGSPLSDRLCVACPVGTFSTTPGATSCIAWTGCSSGYAIATPGSAVSDQACADIDECATNHGGCDVLTTCNNTLGSFSCGPCPAGYGGTGATGCINIDDCASEPCLNGGKCTDGVSSFTCTCAAGYTGDTCAILTEAGSCADGSATVSSAPDPVDLNTTNLASGRSCADGGDAVSYPVIDLTATTATLATAPQSGCLSANDEVLLINVQGSPGVAVNVGNYETLHVSSVVDTTVTFTAAKTQYYGDHADDDSNLGTSTDKQRVRLVRVPNYATLTVNEGATLTASGWASDENDASKGGVLFMRVCEAATIAGSISLDGKGYRGGVRPEPLSFRDGYPGESYAGTSVEPHTAILGGAGGGYGDSAPGCAGYGFAGGGGGYGTEGSTGTSTASGTSDVCTGPGGATYGDVALAKLFFGSGGGSGGNDNVLTDNPRGGLGGTGGGILVLKAGTLVVTGSISAGGTAGQGDATPCYGTSTSACWDYSGPGGGGSGGSIYLFGSDLSLGVTLVSASAGAGGIGAITTGGVGGVGRIVVRYTNAVSGNTLPAADVAVGP